MRLMSLGRLDPKKGLENLIAAVALLGGEVTLDIYGRGEPAYEESLIKLARGYDVADRVRFWGHVDGAAKSKAFAQADLFVLPSHSENFAMVVAEAMAHGVPAIVSHGAPWPRIDEKGVGLWVSNTPESLADAVIRLREGNLQAMGERAREWMKNEFSWDARAGELMVVLSAMTRAPESGAHLTNNEVLGK
ncbi:MAG: glycosyltransferase [Hyphomicrobiales bacterium]